MSYDTVVYLNFSIVYKVMLIYYLDLLWLIYLSHSDFYRLVRTTTLTLRNSAI